MKKTLFVETFCALFIFLFLLYTAVSKLIDLDLFTADINSQPLPNWITPFLVWIIPLAEIAVSVLLMAEKTRKAGFWSALALFGIFSIYIGLLLLHILGDIPCTCTAFIRYLNWQQHIYLFTILAILAVAGIVIHKRTSLIITTHTANSTMQI